MADNLARKIEFNPNEKPQPQDRQRQVLDHHQVSWSILEKTLVVIGTIITASLMAILVSSNISATSAQHEFTSVQRSVETSKSQVSDLHQEIGELTSTSRMNKIAHSNGLTLIDKNIRTIR